MNDLTKLTIKDALNSLKNKEFSCEELTKAHICSIEQQKEVNAYVTITSEIALEQAKESDKRYASGKQRGLEGIPVGIKDIFCTKNIRTTVCSKMLHDFIPSYESTVTDKLLSAGAVNLGKTNMDEFAMGSSNLTSYFGPVNGPLRNKTTGELVVPGGSSGGSSAAVASFQAMAALGSDTGGSIRQPAAFTGIVGMKPSYGRCSRYGMVAFASSLDQAGVLARSVEDTALVLQEVIGYDNKDSTSANIPKPDLMDAFKVLDLKGKKIGVPREYNIDGLPKETEDTWKQGIELLKSAGAEIIEVNLPHTGYGLAAYYILSPAEASSNLARYDGVRYGLSANEGVKSLDDLYELTRAEGFGEEVKRRIMIGTYVLSMDKYEECFLQAQKVRRIISNEFTEAFSKVDALITPTTVSEAFSVNAKLTPLEMYLNDVFTIPASLAGLPCISIPTAISKNGLPLGLQIIGKLYDEITTLNVAYILENLVKFNLLAR
jgi:aspartyl-tRNA(Asn)/glutamyl-tRNA(Gln) amidotransferase subunit A